MKHPRDPRPTPARRGFTLIEVMLAMVILAGVVLVMGMGTTVFSRSVSDSDIRSQAQSVADLQIGRARVWPTYSSLSTLAAPRFNPTADGIASTTTVAVDSSGGLSITKVTVEVRAVQASLMPTPIVRSVSIAAP
jgi:prepilin-type N-terminal cleavage/methylation domain-containing protein